MARLVGLDTRGKTCPVCGTPKSTIHVAVKPAVIRGEIYEPHEYAVCDDCHTKQYVEKYGFNPWERDPNAPEEWE